MGCEPRTVNEGGTDVRRMVCDAATTCRPEIHDGHLYTCPEPNTASPSTTTDGSGACRPRIENGTLIPCPEPTTDPNPTATENPTEANERIRTPALRFGSIVLGGQLGMFPAIRQNAANLQPENGGSLQLELNLPPGDRLFASYGLFHTPYDDRFPSDYALRHRIGLGLAHSGELFRFGDSNFRTLLDQNPGLYLSVIDHDRADGAVSFGVEDFTGLSLDLGRHVNLGIGLQQRSELGGSGPNRVPYNLTTGFHLRFNFEETPTSEDLTPGARLRYRLFAIGVAGTHSIRVAGLGSDVSHIDGLRDDNFGLLVGGLNLINYGNISYNTGQIVINADPDGAESRTNTTIATVVTMLGGAGIQLGGIFGNVPEMSGAGAALFCGGAPGIPRAAGSNDIWHSRGAMIGCGALQLGVGLALMLTAPNLNSGPDDVLTHRPIGAGPDANPHLDVSGEAQRTSGIQIMSAGVGSLGGGFFLTMDPTNPASRTPTGAGVRVGGSF